MAAPGPAAMQGVATPEIDGVRMARSQLQYEAHRSLGIARRVGRRLMRWIKDIEGHEIELERVVGRDPETGVDITETVTGKNGKAIMVPLLPTEDFRKSWELYERTVRNLLQEQRARAQMASKDGSPPISDEVFDAQIAELARRAIVEMPRAELEALLRERRTNIVAGATASDPTHPEAVAPAPTPSDAESDDILAGFGDAESE